MGFVPDTIGNKITELGFSICTVVPLCGTVWSIVAMKDNRRYNIHLDQGDLSVVSIHALRYKYNQWGSKVTGVERVLIQDKKQQNVVVLDSKRV